MAAKPRNRPPAGGPVDIRYEFIPVPQTDWSSLAYVFALGMLFACWYIRVGGE